MKILYGVQGTGNGHISRARMMARHFAGRGANVDFLFSGRDPDLLFDMECFGDYRICTGLSFATRDGAIDYLATLLHSHPLRFLNDIRRLDVSGYDVIVTDFEPVSAWAGRLAGKTVIGIGHQYAFAWPTVPRSRDTLISRFVMRYFAPVTVPIGLHWAAFGAPILPPIIDPALQAQPDDHIVVYLPFESQGEVTALLRRFPGHRFVQYAPGLVEESRDNVSLRPTSLHGFKRNLQSARGVICNAGFELISECLHLGLPVLAKPVRRQPEQYANARALRELGYGEVMERLDERSIAQWLNNSPRRDALVWPDVAAALVEWLLEGDWRKPEMLSARLWRRTHPHPSPLP